MILVCFISFIESYLFLFTISTMHGIDICLFNQELFIIDLINNLTLKLVNSINQGLNFPTNIHQFSFH